MTEAEEIELQASTELVARLRKHAGELCKILDEEEAWVSKDWALDMRVAANWIESRMAAPGGNE